MKFDQQWKIFWDEYKPRLDKLKSDDYHLEAFLLMMIELEAVLLTIVEMHENWTRHLLNQKKFRLQIERYRSGETLTLGKLGQYFSAYGYPKLCKEIRYFTELRNKIIHKFFYNGFARLELEIMKNRGRLLDLNINLCAIAIKINDKEMQALRRKARRLRTNLKH